MDKRITDRKFVFDLALVNWRHGRATGRIKGILDGSLDHHLGVIVTTFYVALHGRLGDEALAANGANVGPLARVGSLVNPQRRPLRERFAAVLAHVRLLSGMHPNVLDQLLLLREALRANLTAVRLVPRVGPVVELELFPARQSLSANIAQY